MTLRHLFGPVSAEFAEQNLYQQRRGTCLCFGTEAGVDVPCGPATRRADLLAQLPAGWEPEVLALYLPYCHIPPALWQAPLPLVGLAGNWNLQRHYYRGVLPLCDVGLRGQCPLGVEVMQAVGIEQARDRQTCSAVRGPSLKPPGRRTGAISTCFSAATRIPRYSGRGCLSWAAWRRCTDAGTS